MEVNSRVTNTNQSINKIQRVSAKAQTVKVQYQDTCVSEAGARLEHVHTGITVHTVIKND